MVKANNERTKRLQEWGDRAETQKLNSFSALRMEIAVAPGGFFTSSTLGLSWSRTRTFDPEAGQAESTATPGSDTSSSSPLTSGLQVAPSIFNPNIVPRIAIVEKPLAAEALPKGSGSTPVQASCCSHDDKQTSLVQLADVLYDLFKTSRRDEAVQVIPQVRKAA